MYGADFSSCCFCFDLRIGVLVIAFIHIISCAQQFCYGVTLSTVYIPEESSISSELIYILYMHITLQGCQLLCSIAGLFSITVQQQKYQKYIFIWACITIVNCLYQLSVSLYVLLATKLQDINTIMIIIACIYILSNLCFSANIYKYFKLARKGCFDRSFRLETNRDASFSLMHTDYDFDRRRRSSEPSIMTPCSPTPTPSHPLLAILEKKNENFASSVESLHGLVAV